VLARGYALCWDDARGRLVRDAATVAAGDRVRVTLSRGQLECAVERVEPMERVEPE
jgi:exonuclease VII large subunit